MSDNEREDPPPHVTEVVDEDGTVRWREIENVHWLKTAHSIGHRWERLMRCARCGHILLEVANTPEPPSVPDRCMACRDAPR